MNRSRSPQTFLPWTLLLLFVLLASPLAAETTGTLPPTCVEKPTCAPDGKHCDNPRLHCYLCGEFCSQQTWLCCEENPLPDPPDGNAGLDPWFDQVHNLCGEAFAGTVVADEGGDGSWSEHRIVMHVRTCDENELAIPLHVGEDRSRTWRLSRTDSGIQLKHDHRHEDGSADAVTLYGGSGTAVETGAIHFPADEETKTLFVREGLDVSVDNVWTMEIVPGERFSYILRRPGRHFQVDFDLTEPVDAPPPPWGSD